jgi:hypothetical protein
MVQRLSYMCLDVQVLCSHMCIFDARRAMLTHVIPHIHTRDTPFLCWCACSIACLVACPACIER